MQYYRSVYTIAKYTALKVVRDRFFLLFFIGLAIIFGLSQFASVLAITEHEEIQRALLSASLRLFVIAIASLFVIVSTIREFNDKEIALIFSFSHPRSCYYLGKLAGFSFTFFVLTALVTIALAFYSTTGPLLVWSISLFCEMVIMTAFSVLCCLSFSHVAVAFSAAFSFYLLARNITLIQSIGDSAIIEKEGVLDIINMAIDMIAYLLPKLHLFTQTRWLVYQDAAVMQLSPVVIQTIIYTALISSAAIFDLYRKEL